MRDRMWHGTDTLVCASGVAVRHAQKPKPSGTENTEKPSVISVSLWLFLKFDQCLTERVRGSVIRVFWVDGA